MSSADETVDEHDPLFPQVERHMEHTILRVGKAGLVAIVAPITYGEIIPSASGQDNESGWEEVEGSDPNKPKGNGVMDLNPQYNGKIGAFTILLLLATISVVTSATTYLTPQVSTVSNAYNSLIMIVGIGVILAFLVTGSRATVSRSPLRKHGSGLSDVMQNHVSLIPIVLFYAIGLVLDIFNIVADGSCSDVWYDCGNTVKGIFESNVTFRVLRIIFMGAVTVFCNNFYNKRFNNTCLVNYGIMFVAVTNLSLLFHSMINEVSDRDEQESDDLQRLCNRWMNETRSNSCFHQTTDEFFYLKVISPYLYPITIEYSLLVCESIFAIFFYSTASHDGHLTTGMVKTPRRSNSSTRSNSSQSLIQEEGELIDHAELEGSYDYEAKNKGRCRATNLSWMRITLCPIACIVFCVLAFFEANFLKREHLGRYRKTFFVYGIVYYFTMTATIPVCFVLSRNFHKVNKKITGLEYLVMFSAVGILFEKMFRISGTIQLMNCGFWNQGVNGTSTCEFEDAEPVTKYLSVGPGLYLTNDAFNILQVIFQIPFLIYCQRVVKPETDKLRGIRKSYETILLFLFLCNISLWFVDSFFVVTEVSPSNIYYGKATWKLLYNLITPFTLFFRFNSSLLFLQVFLRKNELDERRGSPGCRVRESGTSSEL